MGLRRQQTRALASSARLTLNPAQHLPYYFLGFRVTRRTPSPSHLAITASFLPPLRGLASLLPPSIVTPSLLLSPFCAGPPGGPRLPRPLRLPLLGLRQRQRGQLLSRAACVPGAQAGFEREPCAGVRPRPLPGAEQLSGKWWGWCMLPEGLFFRLRCIAARCAAALVCCCWG